MLIDRPVGASATTTMQVNSATTWGSGISMGTGTCMAASTGFG